MAKLTTRIALNIRKRFLSDPAVTSDAAIVLCFLEVSFDFVTKFRSAVTKAEWVSVPVPPDFRELEPLSTHPDAIRSADARVVGYASRPLQRALRRMCTSIFSYRFVSNLWMKSMAIVPSSMSATPAPLLARICASYRVLKDAMYSRSPCIRALYHAICSRLFNLTIGSRFP